VAEQRIQTRLDASLTSDVVGYSRLMETDDEAMLALIEMLRA
jgi:hypothetical protein